MKKKISLVIGCGGNRDRSKRPIIGNIANKYCDKIYLTDDNPRFENPKKIRIAIKKNIVKNKLYEIPNREKAIQVAVSKLKVNEILVVSGKGHENIQDFGNRKIFFSDKNIILDSITQKNKFLSKNLKINIFKEYKKLKKISKTKKLNKASINSKDIKKNDIFFALKGKNNDGNKYISEAINKGASIIISDDTKSKINHKNIIKVKNSLHTMTKLSRNVRDTFNGKIIGITGSCGKTSLKNLLSNSLNKIGKASSSAKSYNNKYGVPLSLLNLNLSNNYGIFEIGMDKRGEINFLSKLIKPDIGIITNISYAHAKNFTNILQIAKAKSEIINNIKKDGFIVLNADDKFFSFHKKKAIKKKLNIISFGFSHSADVRFLKINKIKNFYKIIVKIFNQNKTFQIKYKYLNYIKNILSALAVLSILDKTKKLKYLSY